MFSILFLSRVSAPLSSWTVCVCQWLHDNDGPFRGVLKTQTV